MRETPHAEWTKNQLRLWQRTLSLITTWIATAGPSFYGFIIFMASKEGPTKRVLMMSIGRWEMRRVRSKRTRRAHNRLAQDKKRRPKNKTSFYDSLYESENCFIHVLKRFHAESLRSCNFQHFLLTRQHNNGAQNCSDLIIFPRKKSLHCQTRWKKKNEECKFSEGEFSSRCCV